MRALSGLNGYVPPVAVIVLPPAKPNHDVGSPGKLAKMYPASKIADAKLLGVIV
jgi:hypothetical protein